MSRPDVDLPSISPECRIADTYGHIRPPVSYSRTGPAGCPTGPLAIGQAVPRTAISGASAKEPTQILMWARISGVGSGIAATICDGDGAQPGAGVPSPTAVVRSSPGREQFYWRFTKAIDPKRAEQISKRLAYAMGADKSGWDLTQVLRAPGTRNWKYKPAPRVEIISIEDTAYDPDELERTLPKVPAETTTRTEVKLERSAAATPIGDRDQRARERMYAAKRGDEIQLLANGGSVHRKPDGSVDDSADDQSYANALAFWFDKDPARMAAEMERSARVRDKWSERHSAKGETYLEMTIGTAIGSCRQTFRELTGYDAGDEPSRIQFPVPDEPITIAPDETMTLEAALAEIKRLQRRALDQDYRIEMMAGIIADQQQVIAATRAERDQLAELRAEDRRQTAAKRALGQIKAYTPNQKAAIESFAIVAASKASRGEAEAVITRGEIAEAMGAHEATAGAALKSVFDLDGVPIHRWNEYVDGEDEEGHCLRKKITKYAIKDWSSPASIIAAFVDVGNGLTERVKRYSEPRRCPDHPEGGTRTVCAECGFILSGPIPRSVSIGATHSHREPTPAPVDDLVEARS